jgi:hypothetical protein
MNELGQLGSGAVFAGDEFTSAQCFGALCFVHRALLRALIDAGRVLGAVALVLVGVGCARGVLTLRMEYLALLQHTCAVLQAQAATRSPLPFPRVCPCGALQVCCRCGTSTGMH